MKTTSIRRVIFGLLFFQCLGLCAAAQGPDFNVHIQHEKCHSIMDDEFLSYAVIVTVDQDPAELEQVDLRTTVSPVNGKSEERIVALDIDDMDWTYYESLERWAVYYIEAFEMVQIDEATPWVFTVEGKCFYDGNPDASDTASGTVQAFPSSNSLDQPAASVKAMLHTAVVQVLTPRQLKPIIAPLSRRHDAVGPLPTSASALGQRRLEIPTDTCIGVRSQCASGTLDATVGCL